MYSKLEKIVIKVLLLISHRFFDVILMDKQMPELDGLETSRMVRLCIHDQPTMIVMIVNSLKGVKEECLYSDMKNYINKPLN